MTVDVVSSNGFRAHGIINVAFNVDLQLEEGSAARYMALSFDANGVVDTAYGGTMSEALGSLYARHIARIARVHA